MGSFLVWKKDTKAIHCCMPDAMGTTYNLENLVRKLDPDWESIYEGIEIPQSFTTSMAKSILYVDDQDQPQERVAMPVTIDTMSPTMVNGVAVVNLDQVPLGSELFIDGASKGILNDSSGTISFDLAKSYSLRLVFYPYLDWEVKIHVI